MSVGAQIVAVEKLIEKSICSVKDLQTQATYREQVGLDATEVRSRLTSVEGTLEYLEGILDALHIAEPVTRLQA